jgi:hypothetical protein
MSYDPAETYWAGKGRFSKEEKVLTEVIDDKLPHFGSDAKLPKSHSGGANYHLERLRKAKYAYYRWFNDGDHSNIFSHRATLRKVGAYSPNNHVVELILDLKIENAWKEQAKYLERIYGKILVQKNAG